jgi:TolB-like protein/Tfp pilus assembly protein PilF
MAYIDGQSLKDKLTAGPLELNDVIAITTQVAEGLRRAHSKGIIHRDIKPANIMLTDDGRAKIMDFGLAKLEWGVDLTKTATIMGTAAYMSPEQAKGQEVDQRTDIWSLGAMMYEMLSGQRPFKSDHDQAVFYSILHEDPEPITKIRKDFPVELEKIILRSLEKNPQKRYADMSELLTALKEPRQKPISASSEKPSIAVLPFVNMSADPENEYFSDGLSEELINALTKITDLHVVARTSSFAFKGEKADIREIGQKLGVKILLEGSVRKVGNRVRITAQLIEVAKGYHLWSDQYDRDMEDVFAIQDEITEKIMEKLLVALAVKVEPAKKHRPVDLEAYDLYLKGRYYLNKLMTDKALVCYEKALEKDPEYALAYAAVAEVYTLLSTGFGILPSKDAMPKARDAAVHALKLDPTLAEAYVFMALIAMTYDWDQNAARENFRQALELNPNSLAAHQWIEFYWTYIEADFNKSDEHLKRALELDPLNLFIKLRLGYVYIFRRDYGRAIDLFNELIDIEPNYALAHHSLMIVYGLKGMFDEAFAASEKMLEVGPRVVAYLGVLGSIYGMGGKKDKALELLEELMERSKEGYVSSFWIASLYVGLGEIDKAFEWFDKAYEEKDSSLIYITVPPIFDPIRSDPRYKQLLMKLGLENQISKYFK